VEGRVRQRKDAEAGTVREEWGSLTWLASESLTGSQVTVGRVVIAPGQANPRHCHRTCEEVLYLLRGRLAHTVGDRVVTMEAGDTLCVPAGVMHNARNIGREDADMIVAYSSGRRDFCPANPHSASGDKP